MSVYNKPTGATSQKTAFLITNMATALANINSLQQLLQKSRIADPLSTQLILANIKSPQQLLQKSRIAVPLSTQLVHLMIDQLGQNM
jgi:hypothetical protein